MLHDLQILLIVWILSSIWIIPIFPWANKLFKDSLADGGWSILRVIGWLVISLPIWNLSHLGLPINTPLGVKFTFVILALATMMFFLKNRYRHTVLVSKTYIFAEEVLFFFGFFFMGVLRGFIPDIQGNEKFMDFGMLMSYMHSAKLPAEDMWFSGNIFNYYTFSHFQSAIAIQFWGIDPTIGYQSLLALVFALTLVLTFGLAINLTLTKNKVLVGLFAAFLVCLGGNFQTSWYFLARCTSYLVHVPINFFPAENTIGTIADGCSFKGYDYTSVIRFIPQTAHLIPSYSFILADLHAYLLGTILVLTLLTVLISWGNKLFSNQRVLPESALIGILLSLLLMTNSWDALIYGSFISVLMIIIIVFHRSLATKIFFSSSIMLIFIIIGSSIWVMHSFSVVQGLGIVHLRSTLGQFLALWLPHILLGAFTGTCTLLLLKKNRNRFHFFFTISLFFFSCMLLIFPELFYFDESLGYESRANTFSKLSYQTFIQLSLLASLTYSLVDQRFKQFRYRFITKIVAVLLLFSISIYPFFGYSDYLVAVHWPYNGMGKGLEWFKIKSPSEYLAYLWLKNKAGRPRIVEASGQRYTTYSRFSTFTGFPTVVGWSEHEKLWRKSDKEVEQRVREVDNFYQINDKANRRFFLKKYSIEFIIIGDREREKYQKMDIENLKQLGTVEFNQGSVTIIHVYTN